MCLLPNFSSFVFELLALLTSSKVPRGGGVEDMPSLVGPLEVWGCLVQ